MKQKETLLLVVLLLLSANIEAQFLKKLKNRVKNTAEETVLHKMEEKVTQKTEKTFDTIINGKLVKRKRKLKRKSSNESPQNDTAVSSDEEEESTSPENIKPWTKYNFVPGDEIIFEDDLASEENGEFPSRWDLSQGNAENASLDDENIIRFENKSIITPLMNTEKYLPEVFTIEFDAYFNDTYATWQNYQIRFWNSPHHLSLPNKDVYYPINIQSDGALTQVKNSGTSKKFNGNNKTTVGQLPGWKHIAISFNKRTLKVFVDEYRALNIPNYKLKPALFSIGSYQHSPDGKIMAIKNIRIGKGGKKLYDRILEDGKFVTRGILFDVNKASIKPKSYGVINKVAKMMQEHTDLNFSIEGHTDSDGPEDYNQELSAKRAIAVKEALIQLGIDAIRLNTLGKGESVPIIDNATAEGKANNRRVEFVKL